MKPIDSPNKTLHMALPFRERRFSSTYQNTGTSSPTKLHKAMVQKPIHCVGGAGDRNHNKEELRPSSLKKGDSKHSKLNDRKRQREHAADEVGNYSKTQKIK